MAVHLGEERIALERARIAVEEKLAAFSKMNSGAADALSEEYIRSVVRGAIERFQQELVVFGRIDDDRPWRIGLYGIDSGGEQLVVDWRAPFARAFYQAGFTDPLGLERRVSYVGCIDDLFVEEFSTGDVEGTSPLMAELSRSRGAEMRTAVATLQSEQDSLVRLDPDTRLVLRGGPGTGKTVVGLHRAAWLVYNDRRVTADRILVIGPSDKFLQYVSAVLPTLGESRIVQTTFERMFGEADEIADDGRWIDVLDRFENSLYSPGPIPISATRSIPKEAVVEVIDRLRQRDLPWQERRKIFLESLGRRFDVPKSSLSRPANAVWPSMTAKQAASKLAQPKTLIALGLDPDKATELAAVPESESGALWDEIRSRFSGSPPRFSHVIVDEAQDLSLLQLRAVMRRARGVTLVGDDAQCSRPHGIGLRRAAKLLEAELAELDTAYRMSAEIVEWLNRHAVTNKIDALRLVGIRPTGVEVERRANVSEAEAELRSRWGNVAVIAAEDTWVHKGVEYDAVVVVREGMTPEQVYLAASRAAHELLVV